MTSCVLENILTLIKINLLENHKMAETTVAPKSGDNDKLLAIVATFPLVGLIMFYAMKDASPIVKHYAQQSNALLALNILAGLLSTVVIGCLLYPVVVVFQVILIIKAANLEPSYKLPLVGEFFSTLMK